MSFVEMQGVAKTYCSRGEPVLAVKDVSLEIVEGESVAIMGPSGSGKSTLLGMLGGLTAPSSGKLIVDGIDVYALASEQRALFRREYVGFVFQAFQLIPYLTVLENVLLPLAVFGVSATKQKRCASDVLHRVGLAAKASRIPDELSGGEQQRVAIARAVINEPLIILADEPTGNLDTATGGEVMSLFESLNREGRIVILVTHEPENLKYVHRCIRIRDGEVKEDDIL